MLKNLLAALKQLFLKKEDLNKISQWRHLKSDIIGHYWTLEETFHIQRGEFHTCDSSYFKIRSKK